MRLSLLAASPWLLALLCCSACAAPTRLVPEGGYRSELGREHPLSGKIWSRARSAWVSEAVLQAEVAAADHVLLGESHDNADHHLLQARLVTWFLAAHPGAPVGFEMLDVVHAPALAHPPLERAEDVRARVNWDQSGWPAFELYAPIFEAVLAGGGRVLAAHPNRDEVRASMQGIEPERAEALALTEPLPDAARRALAEEIRIGHCGHANDAMVEAMTRAQSFKDAFMAHALLAEGDASALIAGRGHVRRDRGVPLFLQRRSQARTLSVGFVEVQAERTRPEEYDVDAFDFVVFTPRVSDADACEQFREQLERMRKKHGASTSAARAGELSRSPWSSAPRRT